MFKRSLIFLSFLCATVFVTLSLPSSAVTKKVDTDNCTQITYQQVTIDGACWQLEYCDGVLVNKTPISNYPCQ